MLETLRMDIQTCIDEYLKLAPKIFPVEGLIRGSKVGQFLKVVRDRQRFKAEPLNLAIKRLVKKHLEERSTEGEKTLFRFKASKPKEDQSCNVDVKRTIKPLFDKLTEMTTDTEKVTREFEKEIKYRYDIKQKVYFRFNVQHGLEQVELEE
ncbi:MAG: hypothetical protein Q9161_004851 [Pseudevernia consocians]